MTVPSSDRVSGLALALLAVLVVLEARTYTVGFLTDPLGPRAVPFLVALFLLASGIWLASKPGAHAVWPPAAVWRRLGFAVVALVVYAVLIDSLGFFITTTLTVTTLSVTFGGRTKQSVLAAALFTVTVYVLFVYLLGIPLPIGDLFLVSG